MIKVQTSDDAHKLLATLTFPNSPSMTKELKRNDKGELYWEFIYDKLTSLNVWYYLYIIIYSKDNLDNNRHRVQ